MGEKLKEHQKALANSLLDPSQVEFDEKQKRKSESAERKAKKKELKKGAAPSEEEKKPRVFLIDFDGDIDGVIVVR